jgi:putative CocE/NonD family hydrolase
MFLMGGGDGLRTEGGRMEDGGHWMTTSAWPPPEGKPTSFFLRQDGVLSEQAPASESPSAYEFDPSHPVPTIGGQMNPGLDNAFPADGPRDQRCATTFFACTDDLPLSSRRDVLSFETPPLDSGVVIAGPATVDLWISSSAPDTDFTAKLVDVAPPTKDYPFGYAMNLADRIVRVRWSEGAEKPVFLNSGEVRKITVDLLGTGNHFVKGHRIRIDISSSNFPYFDVNPNTGEIPGRQTHTVKAINTVYHDQDHPSHITLPVLPASAMP